MSITRHIIIAFALCAVVATAQAQVAPAAHYLDDVKAEFVKRWPQSRTVNIVFHGHSVPAGYARTPEVRTLDAYPYQTLKLIKEHYPQAIVNTITTAIGGEQSEQGAARFEEDVLTHKPDVIFIDYALNDRTIGVERAEKAWRSMVETALDHGVKIILCTPTPDLSARMTDDNDPLTRLAQMIRGLAAEYQVGLADFYAAFCSILSSGQSLQEYMAQVNHPNARGHQVALAEIAPWLIDPEISQ